MKALLPLLLLFFLACSSPGKNGMGIPTPAAPAVPMPAVVLFDFDESTPANAWYVQNDVVMGGRSSSSIEMTPAGHGNFSGKVSLENNGGFASIIHEFPEPQKLGSTEQFVVRLKGDGSNYTFRVKQNANHDYHYQATKPTIAGQWQTISFPYTSLQPVRRGNMLRKPPFGGEKITEIQFLIGNKRAEAFGVEIDWMGAE